MKGRESISLELNRVSAVTISVTSFFFQFAREMLPVVGNRNVRSVWWKESFCRASHWCRQARQPTTLIRQSQIRFKIRCWFHGADGRSYSWRSVLLCWATSSEFGHFCTRYCFVVFCRL